MPSPPPTLVFDGDCGFCATSAQWIAQRWVVPAQAIAWQEIGAARLGALGLSEWDVRHAAYWVSEDGRIARGHQAVGQALLAGGGWLRTAGWVVSNPPGAWLARPAYWLVARYRHHLPGATDACRVDDR